MGFDTVFFIIKKVEHVIIVKKIVFDVEPFKKFLKKLAFKLISQVFPQDFHAKNKSKLCLNKFQEGKSQASEGMVSERIMGEPSCNSCCSDSRSAGVMR